MFAAFADPATKVKAYSKDYKHLRPPDYWSPSQIKTEKRCPRHRWFAKVARLPTKPSPATQLGSLTHALLELHKQGAPLDRKTARKAWRVFVKELKGYRNEELLIEKYEARAKALSLARVGVVYGPKGQDDPELLVESEMEHVEVDGLPGKGFLDLLDLRKRRRKRRPKVVDWKTCASPDYAETEETLLTNPQAVCYGLSAVKKLEASGRSRKQIDAVDVEFVYMRTKGPEQGWRVHVDFTPARLQEVFDAEVAPWVRKIITHNAKKRPQDVPANFGACFDFNRPCEFMDRCHCLRDCGLGESIETEKRRLPTGGGLVNQGFLDSLRDRREEKKKMSKKSWKGPYEAVLKLYDLDKSDKQLLKGLCKAGFAEVDDLVILVACSDAQDILTYELKPDQIVIDEDESDWTPVDDLPKDHPYQELLEDGDSGTPSVEDEEERISKDPDYQSVADVPSVQVDEADKVEDPINPPDVGAQYRNDKELREALGILDAIDPTKQRRPPKYKDRLAELGYRPQQVTEMPAPTMHWVLRNEIAPQELYERVGHLDEDSKFALHDLGWPARAIRPMAPEVAELLLSNKMTPKEVLKYAELDDAPAYLIDYLEAGYLKPVAERLGGGEGTQDEKPKKAKKTKSKKDKTEEPAPAAESTEAPAEDEDSYVGPLSPIAKGTVIVVQRGGNVKTTRKLPLIPAAPPNGLREALNHPGPGMFMCSDAALVYALYGRFDDIEIIDL